MQYCWNGLQFLQTHSHRSKSLTHGEKEHAPKIRKSRNWKTIKEKIRQNKKSKQKREKKNQKREETKNGKKNQKEQRTKRGKTKRENNGTKSKSKKGKQKKKIILERK